jgi:hypothetical protein
MINSIHLDLDETLLHSFWPTEDIEGQPHIVIELDNDEIYNTIIRPTAQNIINYSRSLVGPENVFILTSAVFEYACQINEKAGFGFSRGNIHAREQQAPARIGYGMQYPTHPKWSKNNVLIDNLSYHGNQAKCDYIGNIGKENYLQVRDYYGVNFPNDPFETDVYEFLDKKHEEE